MTDLRRLAEAAQRERSGPWEVQDGCSFRRIGRQHGGDGDVVCGINQRDGHSDLSAKPEVLKYIAAASPGVILALLDERDALRAALKECRMFLGNPDWGTVRYMEGSEVYGDIQKMKATVESALAGLDAEREGGS